ncbi:MAG: cyclophilin-like fold protein [Bacteroides sp.]|nr:cyclophilin-like fold protein [Bacteroides sp.]
MKQTFLAFALCLFSLGCTSCSTDNDPLTDEIENVVPDPEQPDDNGDDNNGDNGDDNDNNDDNDSMNRNITISVGGQNFAATLEDNEAARAFSALLPMTVTMTEYNGNEKYYNLSQNLPTSSYRPETIQTGDLMLWGSNTVVLFYETFSTSYSYTRIGRIDNPSGLASAVGNGDVSVRFE